MERSLPGYGASQGTVHTGDDIVLFPIAHIYNCKVTVHKRDYSYPIAHPSTASKTLNLVLFDVQSDILSENWSHFCSTRPIEPTERAGLDEPRGVCLESTGPALAHPPPAAGEDAPARAQGRATDAGLSNGCSGSNNGRSESISGSSNGRSGSCNGRLSAQGPRIGPRIAARGAENDPPCDDGAAGEIYGPPVGLDADLHLRCYTQLTQRQQIHGEWSAQYKSDQLHRLKIFYADPQTPLGDLDPHRYLSNRVAKIFGHQWYEGTIITYCHEKRNYGIYWEDGDSEVGDLSVTLRLIEDWYVTTGHRPYARASKQVLLSLSCTFTTIHLSTKQHCEEHSHSLLPSMRSDSPSNSATTR
jgi:hypothetical protein